LLVLLRGLHLGQILDEGILLAVIHGQEFLRTLARIGLVHERSHALLLDGVQFRSLFLLGLHLRQILDELVFIAMIQGQELLGSLAWRRLVHEGNNAIPLFVLL